MAERQPLKLGTSGAETFASTDTLPRTTLPAGAVISPSQITADQDNYNPSGLSTADVVRLDFDANGRSITGLATWTDGRPKILVNTSANYGVLAAEHPDSTNTNRFAGPCDHILPPAAAVTVYPDPTTSRIRVLSNSFSLHELGVLYKGMYLNVPTSSATAGDNPHLVFATSGTGASVAAKAAGANFQKGLAQSTGTTSTGAAAIGALKDGEAVRWGDTHVIAFATVYIPVLSTSGQRFTADFAFSLINGSLSALPNRSSVGIKYSDNLNSGKWLLYNVDHATTEGSTDSGVTVAANTAYQLLLLVDKSLSESRFFINGTYVGRVATNMPTAGIVAGVRTDIVSSVGTTAKELVTTNIGFALVAN